MVHFLVNTLLLAVISAHIPRLLTETRDPLWDVLCALSSAPLVMLGVALLLGGMGLLTATAVTALLLLLLLFLFLATRIPGQPWRTTGTPSGGVVSSALAGWTTWSSPRLATSLGILMFAAFLIPPFLKGIILGPKFAYDDFSYHAVYPALWSIQRTISILPFTYHTYYPMNAEVMSSWVLLHLKSDGFSGIVGVLWLSLTAGAVLLLVRSLGGTLSGGLVLASLAAGSTVVGVAASRFAGTDLAGPAMLLAALALVSSHQVAMCSTRKRGLFLLLGMIIGFSGGTKPTFIPICLLTCFCLIAGHGRITERRNQIVHSAFLLLGLVATGSFWYVRNFFATGNPLFPAEVGPFQGPFTSPIQAHTQLITRIATPHQGNFTFWHIIQRFVDWPAALGFMTVIGYLVGALLLLQRGTSLSPHRRWVVITLVLIGALHIGLFPFAPFSGSYNRPDAELAIEPRFIILGFVIGIVLLQGLLGSGTLRWPALAMMVVSGAMAWREHPIFLIPALTLCTVPFIPGHARERIASLGRRGGFQWAAAASFTALLLIVKPYAQEATDERLFSTKKPALGALWRFASTLPRGSHIASFGIPSLLTYPLLGRTLENVVIPVDAAGKPRRPIHEVWSANPELFLWWGNEELVSSEGLVPNLLSAGIQYVVTGQRFSVMGGAYGLVGSTAQDSILARIPECKIVYQDSISRVWKIR